MADAAQRGEHRTGSLVVFSDPRWLVGAEAGSARTPAAGMTARALVAALASASVPTAVCTRAGLEHAAAALAAAGMAEDACALVDLGDVARPDADAPEPGHAGQPGQGARALAATLVALVRGAEPAPARVFFVGGERADIEAAAAARAALADDRRGPGGAVELVPVLVRGPRATIPELERGHIGLALFVERADDVLALATTQPLPCSLGVVLLAFDEEASIAAAIADARRFAGLYFRSHRILVVDDGSSDRTAELARAEDRGDLRVLVHAGNQGMGASMRDGYAAADTDFVVMLPGDRQVRPSSLGRFLAHIDPVHPERVVLSDYEVPHAGPVRQLMSAVFRVLVRHLGGYRVDVAGAYLFHRSLLERIDARRTRAPSFLYSFQLLEQMRRLGCHFARVTIRPVPREVGSSREARLGRIARMVVEIGHARLAGLKLELGDRLRGAPGKRRQRQRRV
ncbi:glycosyltransferase family 2 protein [Haliangium ochraceum]|uniref:Glycosyl transferase family 2 n=1 Tax=Haliangium ochraceum (strain DSM 14365 / JCM 11303 / SMP-2) TaxID=502025 RepID=D0LX86_HALO1|nr:glycosyltransferase family 2 protein [Haliangium ochraceum]ACY16128.1 glycosyl transferase family 2 [Haliangium ochraceum DSM 14365]